MAIGNHPNARQEPATPPPIYSVRCVRSLRRDDTETAQGEDDDDAKDDQEEDQVGVQAGWKKGLLGIWERIPLVASLKRRGGDLAAAAASNTTAAARRASTTLGGGMAAGAGAGVGVGLESPAVARRFSTMLSPTAGSQAAGAERKEGEAPPRIVCDECTLPLSQKGECGLSWCGTFALC